MRRLISLNARLSRATGSSSDLFSHIGQTQRFGKIRLLVLPLLLLKAPIEQYINFALLDLRNGVEKLLSSFVNRSV